MKHFFKIIVLFFVLVQVVFAQNPLTLSNIQKHVGFLASDKLEGRRAGTAGEQKAMEYIASQFKAYGVEPKGVNGYYQPFEIRDGKKMTPAAQLSINGKKLKQGDDYFFLPFSANKKYTTRTKIAGGRTGKVWLLDIAESLGADWQSPHFDLNAAIYKLAAEASKSGAEALFLYQSGENEVLRFNKRDQSAMLDLPVVYLTNNASRALPTGKTRIRLNSVIEADIRTGHNVVAYIDNQASQTVVLGAHFDHLGYGEDGNSMLRTGEKLIHNGADDNASGTAALMELSRLLKTAAAKNNNYLFIAFSGEELGLFGSKYFTEHPTVDLSAVNYMINMDMVGRLNDSTKTLTIGGFGTSPSWAGVISGGPSRNFSIRIDSSGSGPSDHTSFYRKNIPVLFYFTGLHGDYHRPSDDFDKINYNGEGLIIDHIFGVIQSLDRQPKLAFLKTRETQVSVSSFRVTLGVMPDYTFSGKGIKIDGVTEGRPGALAGLKGGDIIVGLGDHKIDDMTGYMKALNQFKKGDQTTVKYLRNAEQKEAPVTFK